MLEDTGDFEDEVSGSCEVLNNWKNVVSRWKQNDTITLGILP